MDPAEFAVLARQLSRGDLQRGVNGRVASDSSRVRTAYGRAYYALFLSVRAELARRHGIPLRRVAHGALYVHLQHSAAPRQVRKLGRDLEWLYTLRQKADYDLAPAPDWNAKLHDADYVDWLAEQVLLQVAVLNELDFSSVVHRF
jgi:uncharacterized protein (UPF0332 family)